MFISHAMQTSTLLLNRMESCLLDQVFVNSLVLLKTTMEPKRFTLLSLEWMKNGIAYSFRERLMEGCWNQTHDFSTVSMITILKFINIFEHN